MALYCPTPTKRLRLSSSLSLSLSEPKVGGKPRPSMPRRTIPDPGFSYKGSAAAVTAYLHNISAKERQETQHDEVLKQSFRASQK